MPPGAPTMLQRLKNPPARRVLLVGWDGADWKIASPLVDAGELPQLANIVSHGASGPLTSVPPYLSPMLWNSIATGKYADQHGIVGFASTDPTTGKLQAMQSTHRRCKALWNILSEHGLTTHVVGWFASHPAENVNGISISEAFARPAPKGAPWPPPPGSVHPPELSGAFGDLRVRPEDLDPNLLRLFIPRLAEIDLSVDKRPEQLALRLAELYSVHNAAIAALDRGACDFLGVYYHFIDWVCHDFMEFHPPRRPHVSEREFAWYQDVVKSAYRLQDLLLRDLLAHAGAESTVVLCSDHGFHSDSRRPLHVPAVSAGIAVWHRAQGLFAAAGPGIARDTLITGGTVLDITPTVLHLLGFPPAADMDGRVLASALASQDLPAGIESYEDQPGPFPRVRHLHALAAAEQQALLEQFAALGYVDLSAAGAEPAAIANDRDNRWNLAITLRHAGKHEAALALLEELHFERPEDPRYAFHLAACQIHLGLMPEAAETAETLADFAPGNAQAHLLLAELATARTQPAAALAELEQIPPGLADAAVAQQRGTAFLELDRVLEAAAAFRAAIEADGENPSSWLGYAQALHRAGRASDAEGCARQAISLAPTMAAAHLLLGQTLAAQGKLPAARAALQQAIDLNPRLIAAQQALDQLTGARAASLAIRNGPASPDALDRLRARHRSTRESHLQRLRASRVAATPDRRQEPMRQSAPHTRSVAPESGRQKPPIIVSGLPRSGTSLMMQMLVRGGLPAKTDGLRSPDDHNPNGYFEWEAIKRLPRDPTVLDEASGHAVKIVSPLLPHLPSNRSYKLIFMTRPPAEIAASQAKMRQQLDPRPASEAPASGALLARHAALALAALRAAQHIDLLEVDYPTLIADPAGQAARVAEFLGSELLPDAAAMAAAVNSRLYRIRDVVT
ncbi:MAG TPA: alkaline phosphatase family protein [Opitutus sp.]|nr:alkaline phosphatase family protein [Opitutus sp.]